MAQQDPDCYEATKLTIIEPFAALQEAQSSTLKKHLEKATWKETLASCPPFTGVHYSNELLDAFPAHQVRYTQGRWVERCVGFDGSALVWIESELNNPAVSDAVKRLTVPEEGASREVCPLQEGWLRELSGKLTNGWILICDYGMTEQELALPHRRNGTLTGYKQHRRSSSALDQPGEQDITYQVNFSNLIHFAKEQELELVAFTEQGRFLTDIARLHFEDSVGLPTKEQQKEISEFQTLSHPNLLGSRFKVLLLSAKKLGAPA
jgi:SAM-dependent MidA family methyltransferase